MVGHGNNQSDAHLDIDVYLRARVELCQHSSFESLLEVEAHLSGFAVSVWSPLPLPCAECCHAILAVDNSPIMKGPTPRTSHLEGTERETSNK